MSQMKAERDCPGCSCYVSNWDNEVARLMEEQATGVECSQCIDTTTTEVCEVGDSFCLAQAMYGDNYSK